MARYRWRTSLRTTLPFWCLPLLPKAGKDCGDHEWYHAEKDVYRCYHCTVGVHHQPSADR